MSSVSTAELAIYATTFLPTLFILIKHGSPGCLGWFYLLAFFSLRIVGGALILSHSSTGYVIANIGISPLILASAGILHEANRLLSQQNRKVQWAAVLWYHLIVAGAVGILAAGASSLVGTSPASSDLTLVKVGIALLTAAWALLVGATLLSIFQWRRKKDKLTVPSKSSIQLVLGVSLALVFIGIRVIYALVIFVSQSWDNFNFEKGSLAVRVVLELLTELIATLILMTAGWITRNAQRDARNAAVVYR